MQIESTTIALLQDYELVRVWDSLVFEDDEENEMTLGIQASGAFDPTQSRQVLYLVCTKCFFVHHISLSMILPAYRQAVTQSGTKMLMGSSGVGAGLPNALPETPKPTTSPKKPKKVVTVQKQLQNKLTSMSSKMGEIMQWQAKVKDSDKMHLACTYKLNL